MTNKSLVVAVVLLALFCAAGGFMAGRNAGDLDGSGDGSLSANARAAAIRDEHEKLERDHRAAVRELEELRRLVREQARELELAAFAESGSAADGSAEDAGGALDPESEFDWTGLSGLVARNLEALSRSMAGGDTSKLAPEEQTLLMDMYAEFMKVAKHGRTLSDQPFFDERFLGPLLETLHTESLGLDAEQQARLHELVGDLSREYLEPLDLAEALPIEAYGVRQQLLSDFADSMGELITEEQAERWDALRDVSSRLLQGNRKELDFPLAKEGAQDPARGKVVEHWKEAFSIQDDADGRLGPVADSFLQEAQQALARYGQTPEETRDLSSEERMRLETELLELQIASERELMRRLTPEERANVPGSVPGILRFNYSGNTMINTRRGKPF